MLRQCHRLLKGFFFHFYRSAGKYKDGLKPFFNVVRLLTFCHGLTHTAIYFQSLIDIQCLRVESDRGLKHGHCSLRAQGERR